MQKLITEEINQIKNLEERVIFKELLNNIFLSLHEQNSSMYQQLEEKVFHSLSFESNQYAVIGSLIEQKYFDDSHHMFTPLAEEDLEDKVYDMGEILGGLQDGNARIMKVFLECDYLILKNIWDTKALFDGYIKTEDKTVKARFSLKQNHQYIDKIHQLYRLFVQNALPWRTVLLPYAYKVADVYLTEMEEELAPDAAIQEISVDFGEYTKYIKYNVVPVWNVSRLQVKTLGFPIPCKDHKNYEHTISKRELNGQGPCLIEDQNFLIQNIQDREDHILITCNTDEIKEWTVHQIRERRVNKIDNFAYPILSNHTKDSVVEKLYDRNKVTVRTRAELERFLESFEFQDYLKFDHYEISDENKMQESETYSANSFLIDEIRHTGDRKHLIIYMNARKPGDYLLRDILSFLISEIQLQFPEYHCEGKLL